MDSQGLLQRLGRVRATAILRTSDESAAEPAMEAAVSAGFRFVEFTLNTPGAFSLIERFAGREGLAVGAGTVLGVGDARRSVDCGASFIVSPVTDPPVIEEALRLGVLPIPGASTPGEMLRAHAAGAPLQKLFPSPADPARWIRACLGPLPFLRIVPTHGVDAANATAVLDAGAFAVGFVGPLFPADVLQERRWSEIERRGRQLLAAVAAAGDPST